MRAALCALCVVLIWMVIAPIVRASETPSKMQDRLEQAVSTRQLDALLCARYRTAWRQWSTYQRRSRAVGPIQKFNPSMRLPAMCNKFLNL